MGNGEWGVGSGEWGVANGEWRMGNDLLFVCHLYSGVQLSEIQKLC
ncbi:MAG: hypothetical protein V7K27_12020 [Nostoc sp.]